MNDYRIHYLNNDGEPRVTGTITERNEAAARKWFAASSKECGKKNVIQRVELVRENVSATKQQERDTLAVIKKMIDELGPQSYLATAFEGCFQDAENNIEYDLGDSMKARWLHTEAQFKAANGTIEELKRQLAESEKDYETAHAAANEISAKKDMEIAALRDQVLASDDLTDIQQFLSGQIYVFMEKAEQAASEIVKHAENPASDEFRGSVETHRICMRDIEHARNMLNAVLRALTAQSSNG